MRTGELLLGSWVTIGHTDVPDLLEAAGFDWLVFDMEHAPLGPETVGRMIQSVDSTRTCPIVRVGAVDQYMVKSALDMGAHGVLCPLVNSGGEARRAVGFAKYPPAGVRGVAPRKASDYGLRFSEYLATANEQTTVAVQIETTESLANLEEIITTGGVDVAFVGPSDLTMSLGLFEDRGNPKVVDAMKEVVRVCRRHDRTPGILAADLEEAKRDLALGFRFIGLGSDTRFLLGAARGFLNSVRSEGAARPK